MTIIPSQRHRFTMPEGIHYLNCAYMSPLSNDVVAAVAKGAALKQQPWTYGAADFFVAPETFRANAAALMQAPVDCMAIIPSASYGLAIAAANLPLAKGQEIVVLADQFPSNLYIWRERAKETGAQIVTVQRDANAAWTDAVLAAIGPNTAIVAVPHCHWADGGMVDLVAVGAACRAVGSALVLDLTQSLGAMPFDCAAVQPDFAIAACYKWLMSPYGTGMLYVDPRYHEGRSIEQPWINRAGSEDFARLVDYRDDFQPGARRFDMGEKSNPTLLFGAIAGMDMLLEWGVPAIRETLGAVNDEIAAAAAEIGLSALPKEARAPHFLSLSFSGEVPAGLMEKLSAANVFVSQRSQSLRVTPHVYNERADWERLIAVLGEH
jgi:selenocysteine lyase/cysteine desulfurase